MAELLQGCSRAFNATPQRSFEPTRVLSFNGARSLARAGPSAWPRVRPLPCLKLDALLSSEEGPAQRRDRPAHVAAARPIAFEGRSGACMLRPARGPNTASTCQAR